MKFLIIGGVLSGAALSIIGFVIGVISAGRVEVKRIMNSWGITKDTRKRADAVARSLDECLHPQWVAGEASMIPFIPDGEVRKQATQALEMYYKDRRSA